MGPSPAIFTRACRCAIYGLCTWLCLTGFVAKSQSTFSQLLSLEMNSGAAVLKYSLPQAPHPYLVMSSHNLDELRWGYLLKVFPGDRGATGQIGLSPSFLTNSRAFFSVEQATG